MQSLIRDFIAQHEQVKTFWVGLSGGLDSQVLLALMNAMRTEQHCDVRAIHIHHGLSPNADAWAMHCKTTCQQYGMDYHEHRIQIPHQKGDSLENAAREMRYAIFAEYLNPGDILLTAHHQDDQAETVLLQLLRGAGPKGLAGMPLLKPFAKGLHARPFLQVTRDQLQNYALTQQLQWVDDESNQDQSLTRNYIRHTILPTLRTRWPTAASMLARSAKHCADQQRVLDGLSQSLFANVLGSQQDTLSVERLLQLSDEEQRCVLRSWIHAAGYPLPNTKKLATIQHSVLKAAWDRSPCVAWGQVQLRRFRDDLHLMQSLMPFDSQWHAHWDLQGPLSLPDKRQLFTAPSTNGGLSPDIHEITVRYRQGGEKVDFPGRGRLTLKNLFQEWRVLPWERDRIPLLYVGECLVAVLGYFMSPAVTAKDGEEGRVVIARP